MTEEYQTFNEMMHFGVKGMKWGVRKEEPKARTPLTGLGPEKIVRKTRNGETFTMTKDPPTAIHNFLSRHSTRYTTKYNNSAFLTFTDRDNKKIGEAIVSKKSDKELYLSWLEIEKSARGRGYATEAMRSAVSYGKKQGFEKLTLEVPGISPDARHIYKKLGFEVVEEAKSTNDIWGGLTSMEYRIK